MTVQELLSDESKWTKGTNARGEDKGPIHPGNSEAKCFCLIGAIAKCYLTGTDGYFQAIEKLRRQINGPIPGFNDDPKTTFADIRRVIEAANI